MILINVQWILGIFWFEYFELWGFFGSKMVRKLVLHNNFFMRFSVNQTYIGYNGRRKIFLGILGIFWFENFDSSSLKIPKIPKKLLVTTQN